MLFAELNESLVLPQLDASTKDEVIEKMLAALAATGKLHDTSAAREAIARNEHRMSIGMQHGVAIPHAKTSAVDEMLACVAVTREAIDCDAVDFRPSRIFIMTLSPKDRVGPHIRFLSEIGRILKSRRTRERLMQAQTPAGMLKVLRSSA
ncbi:MAG: PTS sugar transporter subunit IIA [Spirochaeta sp.]